MAKYNRNDEIVRLEREWAESSRWQGIKRSYRAEDVVRLRGSIKIENTLAQQGAVKLWELVNGGAKKGYVNSLGTLTGGQAVQQAKAGMEAIYLSGWQVAADNNSQLTMYPDQSLYPVDSVPSVINRINNAFRRADEIQWSQGLNPGDDGFIDYFLPIIADAEAGFGGVLNAFELMKAMITAGVAAVHWEDQLASVKKCGHMGGKVLVPTREAVAKLSAARLAADIAGVPTIILARTDANAAELLTSDIDDNDKPFLTGETTREGFFRVNPGIDQAIARALAYAPYADMLWCETAKPSLEEAKQFAEAIHQAYPDKLLAYNCSPSFNWRKNLDDSTIAEFQDLLGAMGYKYQFITLAGIHNMWYNMFELAYSFNQGEGMRHYVEQVQDPEFAAAEKGYTFVAHQQEVGTGYFDDLTTVIQGGSSSVTALKGSTEADQF